MTDCRVELSEDTRTDLDRKQQLLSDSLAEHPEVSVTYFISDERKAVAAQFIHEIRLDEDSAEVIWNI